MVKLLLRQGVYIRRLHCAAASEGSRPYPNLVFSAPQSDYATLAKRGNHGDYLPAVRNFSPPGPYLLRWAAESGLLSTVDEALRADSRNAPHRPNKRVRNQQW